MVSDRLVGGVADGKGRETDGKVAGVGSCSSTLDLDRLVVVAASFASLLAQPLPVKFS